MKCIILAAGYATRLYPLTENFPKPLLSVGKKTILDWLIDDLADTRMVDEYIVVSNHKFYQHFLKWSKGREEKIIILDDGTSTNETRLGAVRDIQFALDQTKTNDDVLVIAGDNLLDFSMSGFLNFAVEKNRSCVMCHLERDLAKQQRTAIIAFDSTAKITSYEEKPEKPKGEYAVPPFYYYRWEDVKRIPEALSEGCGADAPGSFAAWLSGKTDVYAWEMPGKRYDIGDRKSYEMVKAIFA